LPCSEPKSTHGRSIQAENNRKAELPHTNEIVAPIQIDAT
jgi:hypothetical protein